MKQSEAKNHQRQKFLRTAAGKENISAKPPRKPGALSPKDTKRSVVVNDAEINKVEAAKEKSAKEGRSFFVGNFGESSWRASPIMQDFVMRSRSVLEVKKDIITSLRSTSVPRASDLRQQRSKITPPPFTSIVGSSGGVFESRKSTPSPLGAISTWTDASPFTAKRRQGLGSAPPWSGIKADESWQKTSATSRTPSPHTFAPGGPLPSFSRTPPKLAVSTGRREPKSDTRPERISTQSIIRVRNLVGPSSDSKFSKDYNLRSLTPNSVMQTRNRERVAQLKSIPQRNNGQPNLISANLGKHNGAKGNLANPFSSGGAFKVVQRSSSGSQRVHRLSKSLQEMGLGGQSQRDVSDSNRVSEKRPFMTMEKVPEDKAEEEKEMSFDSKNAKDPSEKTLHSNHLQRDPNPVHSGNHFESYPQNPTKPSYNPRDGNDYNSGNLQHSQGQIRPVPQGHVHRQNFSLSRQANAYHSMMTQQSPIGPNGQFVPRQQYMQSAQYSPQQYPYTSPQFAPAVQPMIPMPPLQLQSTIAPHMVQSKPSYVHPYGANFAGFSGIMNGSVEGNVDPQMGFSPPQFGGNGEYGVGILPVQYAKNDIQYAKQTLQASQSNHRSKKNHDAGRRSSLPSSLNELQGKLNALMNQNSSNSVEIERILSTVEGRVGLLAKTQTGSRFLQQRIADGHPGYFSVVLKEVFADLPTLMVDLFGNYLCQKLIEKCNEVQRDTLLAKLSSHIPDISCDRQGTRAVQKIVSATTTHHQREMFMGSISREADLSRLMRDSNGSHVIHAVLDKFPLSMLKPIFKLAYKSCYKLAVHQHGLCVLKKCMTLARPEDFMDLSRKVLQKVLQLVNDQYGNYLVQHIIDRSIINKQNAMGEGDAKASKSGDAITLLHAQLATHYCRLSKQKFSSNVVEKCLRVGNAEWQMRIIAELMDKGNNSGSSVLSLLQDSYGNYVMQNALNVAQTDQAAELVELIKPHLNALRKNIKKKWERLILAKCSTIPENSHVKMGQVPWSNQQTGKQIRSSYKHRTRNNSNQQHKPGQHGQQQQHCSNWATSGYVQGYNDPYTASANSMHDVVLQNQPPQMRAAQIPPQLHSSQLHPSSQMPPGQLHPSMQTNLIYSQPFIQQMRYPRPQPSTVYMEPHLGTHGAF